MLNKLFELVYAKIFVNILVKRNTTIVYIEESKHNGEANVYEEEFETTAISKEMLEFIKMHIDDSPYYYISFLDNSSAQGAIPSCEKDTMQAFHDMEASKYICVDKKWSFYTSKYDINQIQDTYKTLKIDFIFSPFSILSLFFKEKIIQDIAMYILVEDNYLSLCIFEDSQLLYAKHLDMGHEDEELDMDSDMDIDLADEDIDLFDESNSVNLDDLDVDEDFGSLDDLSNIEDLSDIEEINEFNEEVEDDLISVEDDIALVEEDSEGFNEDYQRYSLVQASLKNFYKDIKYDSKFIENIYIADNVGVSSDLKTYFEDEMFLNVYVRTIDLCNELCDMAKAEV